MLVVGLGHKSVLLSDCTSRDQSLEVSLHGDSSMVLVPLRVLVLVLSLVLSELLRVEFSGVFVTATATLLSHLV